MVASMVVRGYMPALKRLLGGIVPHLIQGSWCPLPTIAGIPVKAPCVAAAVFTFQWARALQSECGQGFRVLESGRGETAEQTVASHITGSQSRLLRQRETSLQTLQVSGLKSTC